MTAEQIQFNGTIDLFIKRMYDALPPDAECQRLFLLWKKQIKDLGKASSPLPYQRYDEVSATYLELITNMRLEGVEVF